MHPGTWAAVHLSGNGDQVHCIIHFGEVQKIQTVFGAVQAQIKNLRLQNEELHGESEEKWIGLENITGAKYVLLHGRKSEQLTSKVYVIRESVLLPGRKRPATSTRNPKLEEGSNWYFVEGPENRELHDMAGEPVEVVTFEKMEKMLADENIQQSQKGVSVFMFDAQLHKLVRNLNAQVCRQNATSVAP